MKHIKNNKRGFTLVEMMLALAIIVIIGWTTVALMRATKDSFMTTYNVNDSSDYAVLYSDGIENAFLRHTQEKSDATIKIDPAHSILRENGNQVFAPSQMQTKRISDGATVDKWEVRAFFRYAEADGKQVVQYKVFVVDNYYSPTYKVMCTHENAIWAPHMGYGKISFANNYDDDDVVTYLRGISTYGLGSEWHDTLIYTH